MRNAGFVENFRKGAGGKRAFHLPRGWCGSSREARKSDPQVLWRRKKHGARRTRCQKSTRIYEVFVFCILVRSWWFVFWVRPFFFSFFFCFLFGEERDFAFFFVGAFHASVYVCLLSLPRTDASEKDQADGTTRHDAAERGTHRLFCCRRASRVRRSICKVLKVCIFCLRV